MMKNETATILPPLEVNDLDELLMSSSELDACMPFTLGSEWDATADAKHAAVASFAPSPSLIKGEPDWHNTKRRSNDTAESLPMLEAALELESFMPPALQTAGRPTPHSKSSSSASSMRVTRVTCAGATTHIGRWTKREHELFLEGLRMYGKSWKKISSLVVTRTLVQIRTHAQKYLQKQAKAELKAAMGRATAPSAAASANMPATTARTPARLTAFSMPMEMELDIPTFFPISTTTMEQEQSATAISSAFDLPSPSDSPRALFFSEDRRMPRASRWIAANDETIDSDTSDPHCSISSLSTSTSQDDLVKWLQHRDLPFFVSPQSKTRRRDDIASTRVDQEWDLNDANDQSTLFQLPVSIDMNHQHQHQQQRLQSDQAQPSSKLISPLEVSSQLSRRTILTGSKQERSS